MTRSSRSADEMKTASERDENDDDDRVKSGRTVYVYGDRSKTSNTLQRHCGTHGYESMNDRLWTLRIALEMHG